MCIFSLKVSLFFTLNIKIPMIQQDPTPLEVIFNFELITDNYNQLKPFFIMNYT